MTFPAVDVDQAADGPHLVGMVEQVEAATKERPGEVLADAGYFSEDNVTTLQKRGMAVLIPPERVRHRTWRERSLPSAPPPEDASVAQWMSYRLKLPENRERYRKRQQAVGAGVRADQTSQRATTVSAAGVGQGGRGVATGLCGAQPAEAVPFRATAPTSKLRSWP
jgi:hypothetical protein